MQRLLILEGRAGMVASRPSPFVLHDRSFEERPPVSPWTREISKKKSGGVVEA